MIAYKGFDENFVCRGFQYEVGKTYQVSGPIKCCHDGFHACENPTDVLIHYPITNSRFAKVEIKGDIDRGERKLCTSKIIILEEICVEEYIRLCKYKNNHSEYKFSTMEADTIIQPLAQIGSTGDFANIVLTEYGTKVVSSGDNSQIVAVGCNQEIVSMGNCARINVSANFTRVSSYGAEATITCVGSYNLVRAKKDSLIIFISNNGDFVDTKVEKVDGKRIKEDTWYTLKNGKFVETI